MIGVEAGYCETIREALVEAGRTEDYYGISLDGGVRWNPFDAASTPAAELAEAVSDLAGCGGMLIDPAARTACTGLLTRIIEARRGGETGTVWFTAADLLDDVTNPGGLKALIDACADRPPSENRQRISVAEADYRPRRRRLDRITITPADVAASQHPGSRNVIPAEAFSAADVEEARTALDTGAPGVSAAFPIHWRKSGKGDRVETSATDLEAAVLRWEMEREECPVPYECRGAAPTGGSNQAAAAEAAEWLEAEWPKTPETIRKTAADAAASLLRRFTEPGYAAQIFCFDARNTNGRIDRRKPNTLPGLVWAAATGRVIGLDMPESPANAAVSRTKAARRLLVLNWLHALKRQRLPWGAPGPSADNPAFLMSNGPVKI